MFWLSILWKLRLVEILKILRLSVTYMVNAHKSRIFDKQKLQNFQVCADCVKNIFHFNLGNKNTTSISSIISMEGKGRQSHNYFNKYLPSWCSIVLTWMTQIGPEFNNIMRVKGNQRALWFTVRSKNHIRSSRGR